MGISWQYIKIQPLKCDQYYIYMMHMKMIEFDASFTVHQMS